MVASATYLVNNLIAVQVSNQSLSSLGQSETNSMEAEFGAPIFPSGGPLEFAQRATYDQPLRLQPPGLDVPLRTRGRLEASNGLLQLPEQEFLLSRTESGIVIENICENGWPRIRVHMSASECGRRDASFMIEASESTVNGGLLDTRVVYAFDRARNISLALANEEPILFRIESPLADRTLLQRAKAFRKLKYLENMFGTRFELPEDFVDQDLKVLDIVFRGLTEGRFSTRGSAISISILGSQVDLSNPPFSGPGRFRHVVLKRGELGNLFGRKLDVGRVVLSVDRASMADPRVIEQLQQRPNEVSNVRLVVLDHQLTYTFQRYLNERTKKMVARQLRSFRNELVREEPKDLAGLVTEALTPDVSSEEAVQIAFGWLQFNHLPDRFCPQEPEINESARSWRVPIAVFYPSGTGQVVAEVVVDRKTGIMLSHPSGTELRRKGEALARTIFHA